MTEVLGGLGAPSRQRAVDALDQVLAHLEEVTEHGGYWMARCPGHEDSRASLSIRRGDRHPVVLKCHAGCELEVILDKLGLTIADIGAAREEHGDWTPWRDKCGCQPVARYSYIDEQGQLLYEVIRGEHKEFAQRRPDSSSRSGWRYSLGSTRRVLYRLPQVISAVSDGDIVYVVEGEKDVHSVEAVGAVATTSPMGAGKWRPEYAEVLQGALVVIVADNDEPGLRHARAIAASLTLVAATVDVVCAAEGKDVTDHLAAGYSLGELLPIPESDTSDSSDNAIASGLNSQYDSSDSSDSGMGYDLRDGPWLDAQQFPPLRYNVAGLLPAGLGIVAAPPKAGKSLLILDWLLAIAAGGPALGVLPTGSPRDVLYFALEDGDRRLQGRCRHLLAEGEPIPERFRYVLSVPPGQVLQVLTDALGKHPDTAFLVIDTLGRIMPLPQQGETTYQRDYRVAVALKRLADERPGLTIVVIHHTRKAFSDDFIDTISGTHGLAGAADTIMTLSRGRGKADGILRVTGRDVIEADYAVMFRNGVWSLDGVSLADARANVARRSDRQQLSGKSAEVLEFVRQFPSGVKSAQVREKFGDDADQYLKRLYEAGRLSKLKRGVYTVSEPSEVSEMQVSGSAETQMPLSEVSETERESGGDN